MASSSFWLISCRRVDQYVLRSKLDVAIEDGEETEEQRRVVAVRWEMGWRVVRQQRFGEEDMNVVNAINSVRVCVCFTVADDDGVWGGREAERGKRGEILGGK